MSDNTSQQGTDTIATDDVGGVKYQRVKVTFGVDGTATDASSSNPLPVETELTTADLDTGAGTDTRAVVGIVTAESGGAVPVGPANPLDVQGTVTVGTLPALVAGSANIGDVDVVTIPAAARTTDTISVAQATDKIMNNLTELTPKFAKITASSSGATTVVSAVTSKKIRVLSWTLVCNGAVNVKWQSHVTPTDLTGLHYFAANGGVEAPFSPVGHFETVSGEALDINLSGAVAVGGSLVYVEV